MKLLIKYPTRGRQKKFFQTLDRYYSYLQDKINTLFLVTIDTDDEAMNNEYVINKLVNDYGGLIIGRGNSKSKIHAVNRDLESFNNDDWSYTKWDILLLASDDMIPQVKGYDKIIREKMEEHFPDTDGCLWFNDGNRKDICTLSILGRKYYDRYGYIYYPEYQAFKADNEFTTVASRAGKLKYIPQTIIKHEHPSYGIGSYDPIYNRDLDKATFDTVLYEHRKRCNFE